MPSKAAFQWMMVKGMANVFLDQSQGALLVGYLESQLCLAKGVFENTKYETKCPVCFRQFETPGIRNRHILRLECRRIRRARQEENKKMLEEEEEEVKQDKSEN